MTIRKGEEWGTPISRPDDLRVVASDADLAALISSAPERVVGLSGGDLHRMLGSPPERSAAQQLPIDVLDVHVDGTHHISVAHVVARRSWWRGQIVAVMNVDHIGDWNVAPRAHPNDGLLDIVEVEPGMRVRERWQARQRLGDGSHVPHPRISVRRGREATWTFDRPQRIWIDGVPVGQGIHLVVSIRPDAAAVVV